MTSKAHGAVNPLQDPAAALRFLVDFAQLDLATLDRPVLTSVALLIDRDRLPSTGTFDRLSPAELPVFQQRLRRVLDALVRTRTITLSGELLLTFVGRVKGTRLRVAPQGALLDMFLYQTMRVLESVDVTRLQTCAATDCRRWFVRVTQKKYCSSRCQSRIYMREARAEERRERLAFLEKQKQKQKGSRRGKTTR